MNKNTYEIQFYDLSSALPQSWWQIWLYLSFPDDTDIPLRRLPAGSTDSLAESDFIRIYTHYFVMEFLK